MESSTTLRWEWLQRVDRNLSMQVSDNTACFSDLTRAFDFDQGPNKPIKKGAYGKVFKVTLKQGTPLEKSIPIALKTVQVAGEDTDMVYHSYVEVVAMSLVNGLVKLNVCPNFPLLYQPYMCHDKEGKVTELNIVEEFSDGDLSRWTTHKPYTEQTLMKLVFQLCSGIVATQSLLKLVNNDIKVGNVLWNVIDVDSVFNYDIYGVKYQLLTDGILFKIGDWGLASGPTVNRDHAFVHSFVEPIEVPSFSHPKTYDKDVYTKHPLAYQVQGNRIPPFKRDYLSLFYMLLHPSMMKYQPQMPVNWLKYALQYVDTARMESTAERIAVFHHLFDPVTLTKYTKTAGTLFQPRPNLVVAPEHNHVFTMDRFIMVPVETTKLLEEQVKARLPQLLPVPVVE